MEIKGALRFFTEGLHKCDLSRDIEIKFDFKTLTARRGRTIFARFAHASVKYEKKRARCFMHQ